MKKIKNIPIVAFAIVSVIISFAAILPSKPLPPKYKNLKVLPKNISEAALDKIMDNFNYSLGVKCDYCHSKNTKADDLNFAIDTKPEKNIARKMMIMTNEMNVKHFKATKDKLETYAVSCYTCHREQAYPTKAVENK
jgi:Photosynthetic reaction centre cytochrome C subunit